MNEALKPCPFCGSKAHKAKDNYGKYLIYCEKCYLILGVELENGTELFDGWRATYPTLEKAAEVWNTRKWYRDVESIKGWISIKDRLPEPKTWVMVYIEYPSPVLELERGIQKTNSIKKIFYDGKSFYCDYGNITHWMPLPEPPKGE